jgi:hypothetical protein
MYDLERLTLLVHILEVLGSNLGQDTGYPEWGFHGFPQSLQVNAGIVSKKLGHSCFQILSISSFTYYLIIQYFIVLVTEKSS